MKTIKVMVVSLATREELIKKHIATHTVRSAEDRAAVSTLETFLISDGRINTNFTSDDKWPNHDGTFEFVSNPQLSKIPEQNFLVQIKGTHFKGTHLSKKTDGGIKYSLNSLAFPAFIAGGVTADPGILFVVTDPDIKGKHRVFGKYMSPALLHSIDFSHGSITVEFDSSEEILYTDESVLEFCKKLQRVIDTHLFLKKLDKDNLKREDAINIVKEICEDISYEISKIQNNEISRDSTSRRMLNKLYDLCYACLILNAYNKGYTIVNERLSWEIAQFNPRTKYLSDFLKGLKYIGRRIPENGQSERLMLKYYNYLWEIRRFLQQEIQIPVLKNLEEFPLSTDSTDAEYYEKIVECVNREDLYPGNVTANCYYIQKKTPFFVNGERYFEITLQLAGLYATKFNRITVYSKEDISTDYSVQIAYIRGNIDLWGVKNPIKIMTNWKVGVPARCLNKLGKILNYSIKLSKNYGEYVSLMNFLTKTGMNLFDIINLESLQFQKVLDEIYGGTNTCEYKEILMQLRTRFSLGKKCQGKYTIRYILLNFREDVLEAVLPYDEDAKRLGQLYLSSKCYPFEKNPYISNLVGKKTSHNNFSDLQEITQDSNVTDSSIVYKNLENQMFESGELYCDIGDDISQTEINKYNATLDQWELSQGYGISIEDGHASIKSYEESTLFILDKLISRNLDFPDKSLTNERFLKSCGINFEDEQKLLAIKNIFHKSNVALIYGAAGTGKTELMKYISSLMADSNKLYLAKTHTALQNLKRRIDDADEANSESIDGFVKRNTFASYDVIFVDECSTIDNRTMRKLLEKIDDNCKLVLAGDIYQIESIDFGNWFYYAKDIVQTEGANVELLNTWRTEKQELKTLWESVRTMDSIITEKLVIDGPFSSEIGQEILQSSDDDEVILCLNYDGKFGLNNMNAYFQNANQNKEYYWAEWSYKVGDRIIFLDTKRSNALYNNLKGKIIDIEKDETSIWFTIDVYADIEEWQFNAEDIMFIGTEDGKTRIKIEVIQVDDETSTEADRLKSIVPFQVSYAVSIHKAQGLEYNSVKIIIPSSNAEKITHSIFYTAITRAKEKLKIFWSAETMDSVVKSFEKEAGNSKSLKLIKEKLGIDKR